MEEILRESKQNFVQEDLVVTPQLCQEVRTGTLTPALGPCLLGELSWSRIHCQVRQTTRSYYIMYAKTGAMKLSTRP